jgi:hypothetical protein
MFREQLKSTTNQILSLLNVPSDKNNYKQIESCLKTIYQEYFTFIFENEKNSESFFTNVKKKFENFVHNDLENFDKEDEFEDMITSKSFKEMIVIIKKILLYIEFHDPPLKLKIDSFRERKIEIKKFKNSECICVEGLVKENKNCMILLYPPVLKNGFVYQGLKPIVIVYNGEIKEDMIVHVEEEKEKSKIKQSEIGDSEKVLEKPKVEEKKLEYSERISPLAEKKDNSNINLTKLEIIENLHSLNSDSINIIETQIKNANSKDLSPIKQTENETLVIPSIRERMKALVKQNEARNKIESRHDKTESIEENLKFNDSNISQNKNMINSIDLNNSEDIKINNTSKYTNYRSTSHHNLFYNSEKFLNAITSNDNNQVENPTKQMQEQPNSKNNIYNNNLNKFNVYNINNNLKPRVTQSSNSNNNTPVSTSNNYHYLNKYSYNNSVHENMSNILTPNTNINSKNERNSFPLTFHGMINPDTSSFKEQILRSYEKIDDLVQTSRSHFESNNEEFVNFDNLEHYAHDMQDVEMEYEMDQFGGTDHRDGHSLNKLITNSLSNSFAINKKKDLISTMNLINIGGIMDRDNLSNASESNIHNKTLDKGRASNLTANMLLNNSDKKSGNGNLYMYQSSERGGLDINNLTRTIEKLGRKVNPMLFKSGYKKNDQRSLSKTPKQNKAKVIGYSPRNNVHYLFNEKQSVPNNIIIKVAQKKNINPRLSNNFVIMKDDKKSSKNSSLSKEGRVININPNFNNNHKTIDDEHNNSKHSSHTTNPKYKEFKGKIRVGSNNYIVAAVKGSPNNPNIQNLPQNANIIQIKSKNNISTSYSKPGEEYAQKKRMIIKENRDNTRNQSSNKKPGKSIDRRVLTNAQTKLCVDDLLSFKKQDKSKNVTSNITTCNREKNQFNLEGKNTKTNFLNIKYA